jgi:hypothetical protein
MFARKCTDPTFVDTQTFGVRVMLGIISLQLLLGRKYELAATLNLGELCRVLAHQGAA